MTYDTGARTAFASRAVQVSSLFEAKFRNTRFTGNPVRVVRVTEATQESSGGGKMARESIILMPEYGSRDQAIVCGWIDVGKNEAEMRSYDALQARHQARHGEPFDIPAHEYDTFLAEARQFFENEQIAMQIVQHNPGDAMPARASTASASTSGGGTNVGLFIALGAVFALVAVGGLAALYFLVIAG